VGRRFGRPSVRERQSPQRARASGVASRPSSTSSMSVQRASDPANMLAARTAATRRLGDHVASTADRTLADRRSPHASRLLGPLGTFTEQALKNQPDLRLPTLCPVPHHARRPSRPSTAARRARLVAIENSTRHRKPVAPRRAGVQPPRWPDQREGRQRHRALHPRSQGTTLAEIKVVLSIHRSPPRSATAYLAKFPDATWSAPTHGRGGRTAARAREGSRRRTARRRRLLRPH